MCSPLIKCEMNFKCSYQIMLLHPVVIALSNVALVQQTSIVCPSQVELVLVLLVESFCDAIH